MGTFIDIVSVVANFFTIAASALALYLFFFKGAKISLAINVLLNYSKQLSLSELKSKLDRLNSYNASDEDGHAEVINIISEVEGQIKGNSFLKEKLNDTLSQINEFIEDSSKLTEPRKRSLVHELRESIRNLDVDSYNKLVK